MQSKSKNLFIDETRYWVLIVFLICSFSSDAQIKTSVDSTAIKIGEELLFALEVEVDSASTVVFPEGKTFGAMELLENYETDTLSKMLRIRLLKKYGLTQFDSGVYTIPQQKVLIGDKLVFSDSIEINVLGVAIDTTQQKMFEIKPIIEVKKQNSFWRSYWWVIGLLLLIFAVIWYFFYYQKKGGLNSKKTKMLPAYEQAKLDLNMLNEDTYFENKTIKAFYSELTFILRKYLNKKVYDQALESTTEELLETLYTLKKSKQIRLGNETLKNIGVILRRADLVKFAKSKPAYEIARMDKQIIATEIDQVKAGLPTSTETELEQTAEYNKHLQKKKRKRQIMLAGLCFLGLLFVLFVSLSLRYGFETVKDSVFRHPSKLLLEKQWVSSEYGAPGISLETPNVLTRVLTDSLNLKEAPLNTKQFRLYTKSVPIDLVVKSSKSKTQTQSKQGQDAAIDLLKAAEDELLSLEQKSASNILPKNEKFTTSNEQEGLKTYGTANFMFKKGVNSEAKFTILGFSNESLLQQLIIVWDANDRYASQISQRILGSVELLKQPEK